MTEKRVRPDFEDFTRLTAEGKLVPVYRRLLADLLTPVSALQQIREEGERAFLLESVEGGEKIARYSFLGCHPFVTVRSRRGRTVVEHRDGREEASPEKFLHTIRRLFADYRSVSLPGLPPFCGGAVGYLGYDLVREFEDIPERAMDDLHLDDAVLMFYSTLLAFDHVKHQIWIVSNAPLVNEREGDPKGSYARAIAEIDDLESKLNRAPRRRLGPNSAAGDPPVTVCDLSSNFSQVAFEEAVRRAKDYIRAGEIFQVVLSQRFQCPHRSDPLDIYRALRIVNPSPYMFFLEMDDLVIAGASPEMLIKVQGDSLEYRPIAGTRPRGSTDEEDQVLASDLLADPKERAEHVMLVDLGRNDLGRVSEYGSVKPRELFVIEKYSHVMHLVSALEGKLRAGLDRFDALAAAFPAGTVSGAPKIRAMKIVDELEPTRRSVYAGSVAYIDFSGNLDSCITIRTFVMKNGTAYIQAGAGIVADSLPHREYQESVNKAQALVGAVRLADGGFRL